MPRLSAHAQGLSLENNTSIEHVQVPTFRDETGDPLVD